MIGKIKDLIYDFNDILVALLILAVAGGVITWKLADIMAYPEYLARQQENLVASNDVNDPVNLGDIDLTPDDVQTGINTGGEVIDPNAPSTPEPPTGTDDPAPATPTTPETPTPPTGETKITIPAGSYASKIAQILFDAGLITSTEDFLEELTAEKADTKLKAGTFTIPAGSTMQEIIAILVK